ncbi:hypothetical protein DYB32_000663 [Aphanomyces invadans]|nr:hypothetical protein DYB32_000663 [Aphanomyces invadans]
MEEQREADNHARLLAEAQKQRRDRENQQIGRASLTSNGNSQTSPAKRPSFYRRPSQGRGAYLASSSSSLQSSVPPPPIHTNHVDVDGLSAPYMSVQSPTNGGVSVHRPPTSVNERIEALKARNSLPQHVDSYSSEPGFLVHSPPFPTGAPLQQPTNPRDTTLTGYSMDIDGDYESTVGDTFLSPSTKDSLYQELDAAKLNSPTRAAAAAIKSTDSKRSDGSDFELDVDGDDDAALRERVPSHRSIEF